jgi:O-antigen/teichoic acid export membrane protein
MRIAAEFPGLVELLRRLTILGLRSCNIASKFLLALYTARYLGLADLGIYGLLVGAATGLPALLGFGLTAWIMRKLVDLPSAEAIPLMWTRLCVTVATQLAVQPAFWLLNAAAGSPVSTHRMILIGLILLLEGVGTDVHGMLTARRRILVAEMLFFVRAGLWPLPIMILGLWQPQARSLDVLLLGWTAGLGVTLLVLAACSLSQQRWRHFGFVWREIFAGLREAVALYTHDICLALNLYLDRFLISLFLSLPLTGVYTFFWSFANVAHALTIYGVLTPQISKLVEAGRTGYAGAFRATEKRVVIEIALCAVLICAFLALAMPFLLPYVARPALNDNLAIYWIVIVATLFRIGADAYGYMLYSLRLDTKVAKTSIAATLGSACLNLLLVPYAGIFGAAAAFLLTASAHFAARLYLTKSQGFAKPGARLERAPGAPPAGNPGNRFFGLDDRSGTPPATPDLARAGAMVNSKC